MKPSKKKLANENMELDPWNQFLNSETKTVNEKIESEPILYMGRVRVRVR